jgi:transcriptional regulator with XRE-family HTH domain
MLVGHTVFGILALMPLIRPALREARVQAGLTQDELAGMTGYRQPHIARWESGKQLPRVDTALRLAAALKTTVEALWA